MSTNVAKIDLSTFTDAQKELHTVKVEGDDLYSHTHREFRRSTWRAHLPCKMTGIQNEDYAVYKCPGNFDNLLYSYRVHNIPAIRVKEEYKDRIRIAWPHNLGINLCTEAKLLINEEQIQCIDSISNDIAHQYFVKPGQEKAVDRDMGNVPELENFGLVLPEYQVIVADPWYYSKDPSLAIPLYLCSILPVTHEYRFRTKISDVLRIRELVPDTTEETWKDIPYNAKYFDIASATGTDVFQLPELWGRFDMFDEDERQYALNFWREEDDAKPDYNAEKVFWIDDFVKSSSLNPTKLSEKISATMESTRPVKAFYWLVENMTNTKTKNFSNYTTSLDDVYKGRSPWAKYGYKYATSDRLPEMEPLHASRVEPRFHSMSVPRDPGYGMYSYSIDPLSLDASIGIVLTNPEKGSMKAQLTVMLRDDDPYDRFDDEEKEVTSGLYQFHVRLLVTRKLSFKYIKDSNPFGFKVEIK